MGQDAIVAITDRVSSTLVVMESSTSGEVGNVVEIQLDDPGQVDDPSTRLSSMLWLPGYSNDYT
jgi:hypothetical protein